MCMQVDVCKGGCKGYSKLINNDWTGKDPRCESNTQVKYIPLCPIVKMNVSDNIIGGSSEQVLERE